MVRLSNHPHPVAILNAGARAALVLMALVETANLATGLAFTTRTIQARVDEAVRRRPGPMAFDDQANNESRSRQYLRQHGIVNLSERDTSMSGSFLYQATVAASVASAQAWNARVRARR